MRYIVKEFDKPLLIFSADMNSSNSNLQIEKIYEERRGSVRKHLCERIGVV